ncbi:MAG: nitroreductase family deazaflavin-dependent oxidoreductase [Segniliparus sp.]|uniref:nitroreductase family deazaflavin-dependent oxidoreductase n=1 Tax=Segniliparus sp. TaxID=2804064 RepID=UPI003F3F4935
MTDATSSQVDPAKLTADQLNGFNQAVVAEFRANGGKVGGAFDGVPLALLHTVGAKSGQPRTNPLFLYEREGRRYLPASYAGADKDPAWAHNLRANPAARVEFGAEDYEAVARELPEEERAELFAVLAAQIPTFAQYQAKTSRKIPLFELVRG